MPDKKDKSLLEETLQVGMHGTPELKPDEKRRFLGVFRERVIKALTIAQLEVNKHELNEDFVTAMNHKQACILIVRGSEIRHASSYLGLARKNNLNFKAVSRADLIGDVAMLIAAEDAVNIADIWCY